MYGADLAEVFELIHQGRGKDYLAEAADVAERIRARTPGADSLLDVACGTGSHLRAFATLFGHVEGLEISEPFARRAEKAVPGRPSTSVTCGTSTWAAGSTPSPSCSARSAICDRPRS
ncbi:methyltransferase domain-containing protein [Micromonospora sp. BRA006-A]|nr:methyltransferase domain-containing protein [Micromonospora sp. BRA006-A]